MSASQKSSVKSMSMGSTASVFVPIAGAAVVVAALLGVAVTAPTCSSVLAHEGIVVRRDQAALENISSSSGVSRPALATLCIRSKSLAVSSR